MSDEHTREIPEENYKLFFHTGAYEQVRKQHLPYTQRLHFSSRFSKNSHFKRGSCICVLPDPYPLNVSRALKVLSWPQILKISCPKISASSPTI